MDTTYGKKCKTQSQVSYKRKMSRKTEMFLIFETKDENSLFRARSQINKFKNTGKIRGTLGCSTRFCSTIQK